MSTKDTPPPETEPKYIYMRTKAKRYLDVGPEVYRQSDYFAMPPADWSEELLKKVECGMRQIIEWKGISPLKPFTGIGIDGFYSMMSVLHFDLNMQQLVRNDTPGLFMDRMTMQHHVDGETVVLYNEVPMPEMPPVTKKETARETAKQEFEDRFGKIPAGAVFMGAEHNENAVKEPFPCPVTGSDAQKCPGTMRLNKLDFWECDVCHRQAASENAIFYHKKATLIETEHGKLWLFPADALGKGNFRS